MERMKEGVKWNEEAGLMKLASANRSALSETNPKQLPTTLLLLSSSGCLSAEFTSTGQEDCRDRKEHKRWRAEHFDEETSSSTHWFFAIFSPTSR